MIRQGATAITSLALRRRSFAAAGISISNSISRATNKAFTTGDHDKPLVMGCVSYDPSVGEIWSGIQDYLVQDCGVPFRYVLFDTYEDQVAALTTTSNKKEIDLAWNGPLAHVLTEIAVQKQQEQQQQRQVVSLGMRDVDQDFASLVVVRKDANIAKLEDLNQRHLLQGTRDSPQACIVPYYYLTQEMQLTFDKVTQFDADVGKHGDTALGEIQALDALVNNADGGQVATISRMMWDRALQGQLLPTLDPQKVQDTCHELTSVPLPTLDHCMFDTVLSPNDDEDKQAKLNDFGQAILDMNWDNPKHQHLMKLEGIRKEWKLPRNEGYDIVRKAVLAGRGPAAAAALANHTRATNFQYQNRRAFSSSTTTTSATAAATSSPKRIAVIGAGVAGLQSVRALKARGLDVTVFEASSKVGGIWKSNYANFGVQVPKQLYEFQDYPMTQVERGEYASGPQVQEYIESYADAFGLADSIQYNTKVTSVVQQQNQQQQQTWTVRTEDKDGQSQESEFDYLVVATGLYSNSSKFIPSIPGLQDAFQGHVLHSSDFSDAAVAQDKRVVVIGGGKSAVDCALEASKAGAASVTLLQRTAHWPTPRKIAGLIPFQYIFLSRLGTALVSAHRGTFPGGSGMAVNAFRNSVVGPLLMRPVFGLVEELFAYQFGLRGDLRPKGDVVSDFYKVALVLDSELKEMRRAGKVDVKLGEVAGFHKDGTSCTLKDGSTLSADLVVSATGFSQDYSFFSDPSTLNDLDIQDDGAYFYRYILPEKVPNLAFIGNVGAISNSSSYGLQAEWLARHLTGDLVNNDASNSDAMREEIEARKEWARSWMPASSYRGMLVLLHQTHYHDQLLKDMGLSSRRKSNPLSEYFMPYESADYNDIVGGTSKGDAVMA